MPVFNFVRYLDRYYILRAALARLDNNPSAEIAALLAVLQTVAADATPDADSKRFSTPSVSEWWFTRRLLLLPLTSIQKSDMAKATDSLSEKTVSFAPANYP